MRMHSTSETNCQYSGHWYTMECMLHTHTIANATSVTRNLLSTSHGCPTLPTIAAAHPSRPISDRVSSSSARNVNAHRSPHHAAGTVLSARLTISGTYHLRSTPRMTATRGCKGGGVPVCSAASLLVFRPWDVEEVGDCGRTVDVEDKVATALSRGGGVVEVESRREAFTSGLRDGPV